MPDIAQMTEAQIEAEIQTLGVEQEAIRARRVALKGILDARIHARHAAAVLAGLSPEVRDAVARATPLAMSAATPKV